MTTKEVAKVEAFLRALISAGELTEAMGSFSGLGESQAFCDIVFALGSVVPDGASRHDLTGVGLSAGFALGRKFGQLEAVEWMPSLEEFVLRLGQDHADKSERREARLARRPADV